jgi:type IV secretion system protein VirD4
MSDLDHWIRANEELARLIALGLGVLVLILGLWLLWKLRRVIWWGVKITFFPITLVVWWLINDAKRAKAEQEAQEEAQRRAHGSARYGQFEDLEAAKLTGQASINGLIVGMTGTDGGFTDMVRYPGAAHLLTMAPTGSGKGVSAVLPNLLTYQGGVICIDPKGENAAVTARQREAMGQEVHVLDPWGVSGIASASYNPLDLLDPDGPDFTEDAMLLADCLVIGGGMDSHWDNEARALIAGLLMYIATHEAPENRHLPRLYELLSLPAAQFEKLMAAMMESPQANVRRAGARMTQKAEREASGVISSAQANLHFLDSGRMGAVLKRSNFSFSTMKEKPFSLFLVLPADRLQTYNRWLRLLISVGLASLARDKRQPAQPVLFLLDEFAALGHLRPVEIAMGLLRGYGVKLWPILQDINQLKANYARTWESFIANAGAIQVFGCNDGSTADYISRLTGTTTAFTANNGSTARALFTPDEIRQLPSDNLLLLVQQQPPFWLNKPVYYRLPFLKGLYDPNPYHIADDPEAKG